jgi:uncharacterized protein (TIGR04222 family)
MDWLVHNPIADLSGPEFLVLYGVVIAATLLWCWWQVRASDPTTGQAPPPVPASPPDPYALAYLRGGENEVTRVAVFSLLQRGYLQAVPVAGGLFRRRRAQQLEHAPKQPDHKALTPIERRVFEWFSWPRNPVEIFRGTVPTDVKQQCAGYEQHARQERLLMPDQAVSGALRMGLLGAAVILGLGAYKLAIAVSRGYPNVWFLIIMAVVSLFLLRWATQVPRLSRRGEAYLRQLRQAYEPTRAQMGLATGDDMLPLMIGLFGLSVLSGSPFHEYDGIFPDARRGDATSGCGSFGSSSSCSGDGDGGGCGGCGGGGD